MAKLLVGAALSHHFETKRRQQTLNFPWLEDGRFRHRLPDDNSLCSDEIRFQNRLTVFEQHSHDLAKVSKQLVQGLSLGVGARKTRNIPNEQTCVRTPFND